MGVCHARASLLIWLWEAVIPLLPRTINLAIPEILYVFNPKKRIQLEIQPVSWLLSLVSEDTVAGDCKGFRDFIRGADSCYRDPIKTCHYSTNYRDMATQWLSYALVNFTNSHIPITNHLSNMQSIDLTLKRAKAYRCSPGDPITSQPSSCILTT